jgi:hypothetical protein
VLNPRFFFTAGMIFTSLNVNRGEKGHEHDNAITVAKRIIEEKGVIGLFYGGGPMCLRQASNWASRSCLTGEFVKSDCEFGELTTQHNEFEAN